MSPGNRKFFFSLADLDCNISEQKYKQCEVTRPMAVETVLIVDDEREIADLDDERLPILMTACQYRAAVV